MGLNSTPAHAVWYYSLAAQVAIHDGILAMYGETEPRIKAVLSEQWSQHLRLHGMKEIGAARKSAEYSLVYRGVLFDQLLSD